MIYIYILLVEFYYLVLWVVSIYNFFVSSKTRVGAAVQEIGNQLKTSSLNLFRIWKLLQKDILCMKKEFLMS